MCQSVIPSNRTFSGRCSWNPNITDVIRWDASGEVIITPSDELSDDVKAAIAEVSEHIDAKTGRRMLTVKLHSKTVAIELLNRQRVDEDHEKRLAELEAR